APFSSFASDPMGVMSNLCDSIGKESHMSTWRAGVLALVVFGVGAGAATAATCGGHGTRESLFVSTTWLADHIKDANLVVLAVGSKADYDAGHIAGSGDLLFHRPAGERPMPGFAIPGLRHTALRRLVG